MKGPKDVYSRIGIALKAGRLVSGALGCEKSIKSGKAELVIITEDASQNTKKKFGEMCNFYGVKLRIFGEKELMGRYLGKENRSVAAVMDINLSKLIIDTIDNLENFTGVKDIGKN